MDFRSPDRLTRLFASLLAPLAVGCVADEGIDEAQFTENLCEGGSAALLPFVEPAEAVDYLEDRFAEDLGIDTGTERWNINIQGTVGMRCGGATDPAACQAAFDALPLESDFPAGFEYPGYASLAFTRGDEVGSVGSAEMLRAFLGAVDAPGDAALLATYGARHRIQCEASQQVGVVDDGYVVYTRTGGGCGEGDDIEAHVVHVSESGVVEVVQTELIESGDPGCSVGRLPAGLCRRGRVRSADPVGTFFADVAHLEAAAVAAFGQLARELQLHGAPPSMVRAARRSRTDEIRHARVMATIARRHGGEPIAPRVRPTAARSLVEVVADNAAEGCTRETYGALVAHVQARRARDPRVRRALARIAEDETRHAALSWSFDAWARARMNASARRDLDRERARSWDRLEVELTAEHHARVHAEAGMPGPDEARALYRGLRAGLRA